MTVLDETNLRCVDITENLKLFHNTNNKVKGIITDSHNNVIVNNFPVPIEYILSKDTNTILEKNINTYPFTIYNYIEGTSIRVFKYANEWKISTTSRLDAYTSYWSNSKSFGTMFSELLTSISEKTMDDFFTSLDENNIYYFILPTFGTSRIGAKQNHKKIFLVGIQEMNSDKIIFGEELKNKNLGENLWSYLDSYVINSREQFEELLNKNYNESTVENNDSTVDFCGYLVYDMDMKEIYRLVTESYYNRCKVRNNNSNLFLRYIQLKKNNKNLCDDLINLFPEISFHDEIDVQFEKLCKFLHKMYINRYVYKEYIILEKKLYNILKKAHIIYLDKKNPTTIDTIKEIIYKNNPKIILSLIRNFSHT